MDEKKYSFINIFLIFGLTFLAFGLIALIFSPESLVKNMQQIFLICQIVLGTILSTVSISLTKKGYQLYTGLLLFGWGFNTYLMVHIFPFTMAQWWPSYGILAGFFVIFDGLFIYKKFKTGFLFPSLVIIFASAIFFLFSFKIIKFSFIKFVLVTGPILILLAVIFFSAVYFIQKKTKKLIFSEDQNAFDEEQLPTKFDDFSD